MQNRLRILALFCLVLLSNCKKQNGTAGSDHKCAPPPPSAPSTWSDEAKELLKILPASATGIAVIDFPEPLWQMLVGDTLFPFTKEESAALDKDLRALLQERKAPDVDKVRAFAVAADVKSEKFVVLVSRLKGPISSEITAEFDKPHRFVDSVFAVGDQEFLDQLGKGAPSALVKAITDAPAGLAVIGELSAFPIPPAIGQGLERVTLQMKSGGVLVTLTGTAEALDRVKKQIEGALAVMESGAIGAVEEEKKGNAGKAFGAIYGVHLVKAMARILTPSIKDKKLTIEVPFTRFQGGAAALGIAAAIALPAFKKYQDRARAIDIPALPDEPTP
jgi:hypothetical protein